MNAFVHFVWRASSFIYANSKENSLVSISCFPNILISSWKCVKIIEKHKFCWTHSDIRHILLFILFRFFFNFMSFDWRFKSIEQTHAVDWSARFLLRLLLSFIIAKFAVSFFPSVSNWSNFRLLSGIWITVLNWDGRGRLFSSLQMNIYQRINIFNSTKDQIEFLSLFRAFVFWH